MASQATIDNMHGCCFTGFRVPTLYKYRVLFHSCLACSTLLLSLVCRQVEGSGLSIDIILIIGERSEPT